MNKELEAALMSIGALAEMISLFCAELEKHGFSRAEAIELCKVQLSTMISGGGKRDS